MTSGPEMYDLPFETRTESVLRTGLEQHQAKIGQTRKASLLDAERVPRLDHTLPTRSG